MYFFSIFCIGLVLFKHNVLNTDFDDREQFWKFKEEFALKKIKESSHQEPNFDEKNINRDDELRRQRAFSRNLCITGFPNLNTDVLPDLFIHLCQLFDLKINENDIESCLQRKGLDIIVRLKERNTKGEIQKRWKQAQTNMPKFAKKFSTLVNHFHILTKKKILINICSDLTPFFQRLWGFAEKAKKEGKVSNFFMTDNGLVAGINGKRYLIWSQHDLDNAESK